MFGRGSIVMVGFVSHDTDCRYQGRGDCNSEEPCYSLPSSDWPGGKSVGHFLDW